MGPPPRSLTAEANSCFMVRVPHGPNRIQGCGASIAPERGLPSDQLYRTSNNEGHRVAVTLDTKVLIQAGVALPALPEGKRTGAMVSSQDRRCGGTAQDDDDRCTCPKASDCTGGPGYARR